MNFLHSPWLGVDLTLDCRSPMNAGRRPICLFWNCHYWFRRHLDSLQIHRDMPIFVVRFPYLNVTLKSFRSQTFKFCIEDCPRCSQLKFCVLHILTSFHRSRWYAPFRPVCISMSKAILNKKKQLGLPQRWTDTCTIPATVVDSLCCKNTCFLGRRCYSIGGLFSIAIALSAMLCIVAKRWKIGL